MPRASIVSPKTSNYSDSGASELQHTARCPCHPSTARALDERIQCKITTCTRPFASLYTQNITVVQALFSNSDIRSWRLMCAHSGSLRAT
ncbi:hypothetical protein K503DRAFT_94569 [Rhizopogon vinicolor AM-OR11-026]|uniref:Uncharacterized protein n=1 Tax=Rhizopogon vinicolor AM-OR11-026 TaxID=1314800 RepID=A0A1B7N398_9AGAM|nr:hypothetical protein K503DRAFT_94569 [Rhizopogon vinicolor AM-OR11-026]